MRRECELGQEEIEDEFVLLCGELLSLKTLCLVEEITGGIGCLCETIIELVAGIGHECDVVVDLCEGCIDLAEDVDELCATLKHLLAGVCLETSTSAMEVDVWACGRGWMVVSVNATGLGGAFCRIHGLECL